MRLWRLAPPPPGDHHSPRRPLQRARRQLRDVLQQCCTVGLDRTYYRPIDADTFVLHSVLIDRALSRGYAVATSSLNVLGWNCNDVVSAEAFMMTKEHVIETYGEIRFTMTEGGSGGSVLQSLMADNYPGLVDGVQPYIDGFPDMWIVAAREYNEDPVARTMLPSTWLETARRRTILVFYNPGGGRPVERYSIGRFDYDGLFWLERTHNDALHHQDAGAFARALLVDVPPPPGLAEGRSVFEDRSLGGCDVCHSTAAGHDAGAEP